MFDPWFRSDKLGGAIKLVVEDDAETVGDDQGKDVVLVFRRILGPADGVGRIPDPRSQRLLAGTVAV